MIFEQIGADEVGEVRADRVAPCGVAAGVLLDHPLEHAGGERDAGGLDRLQVAGRQEIRRGRIAPVVGAVRRGSARDRQAARRRCGRAQPDRPRSGGPVMVGATRPRSNTPVRAERDHARPRHLARQPRPPDQRPGAAVRGQRARRRQMIPHLSLPSLVCRRLLLGARRDQLHGRKVRPVTCGVARRQSISTDAACAPM